MILRLIVRRLFFLVFVLLGLSLITFTLSHIVPRDPARMIAGPRASPEAVEKIRKEYGLDQPLAQQYFRYVTGLFTFRLREIAHFSTTSGGGPCTLFTSNH